MNWTVWTGIAALAGVIIMLYTGVLDLSRFRKEGISVGFTPAFNLIGRIENYTGVGNPMFTTILISGAVYNSGQEPIVVSGYRLSVHVGDRWVEMENLKISQEMGFQGDEIMDITLKEPWKYDLLDNPNAVTQSTPLRGHLLFRTRTVGQQEMIKAVQEAPVELTVIDIKGKEHKLRVDLSPKPVDATVPHIYPHHGTTVSPKKGDSINDRR